LHFEVSDTGIGIAPEHQATLFDEFSQVADSKGRQRVGTGLGLSISQRIVNLMGGRIRVESSTGNGSRFWFEIVLNTATPEVVVSMPLPVSEPVATPACRAMSEAERAALPVLLVDDVPTNTLVARSMLKKAGYSVETVADGIEALEAVCKGPFGCILMDLEMPIMDGLEATRRIRALAGSAARVPIIAMTAHAMAEEKGRCIDAGMDDFVSKPFSREQFLEVLARWYGGQHEPATKPEQPDQAAPAPHGIRAD
jgi:CheY-like chemotaxis protein